ncbi:MFS transporter [Rhodophyticola sp. CCM32]|uniref:MFS transporter n=1 Tax=Rhodophyticola sp. CCM32 TaxID=2916397 RepID=UPI00107F7891|nr:MFS transporter [Rhodophyticola sp. CCM32]QBY00982.1 MFS transporter [Rhodophyticola sp. CCM32]
MVQRDKTDWPQVFLLWGIGLFAAAQFGKVSLAFESLGAVYARPDPVLALVVSSVGVAGIFLGAVAGMAAGRFGPRPVLLAALLAGGALSVLQGLLPPFPVLIGLRVLEGLAHLSIVVAAPVLMVRISTLRDQPLVMALWASFFGVSFALSALILPVLIDVSGLGGMWMIHGLCLWLLAALVWRKVARIGPSPAPWPGFLAAHRAIYSDPRRLAPALGFFWHTLVFVALLTFLAPFVAGDLPVSLVASILPLTALAGTFLAGWLARHISPLTILKLSFVTTIAGMILLVLVPDLLRPWVAFASFVSIGVAPGAGFAAIPALNDDPVTQAEANGALAQLGNVGTSSGSPLFALAMGAAGLAGLVAATVAIMAIGLVAMLWITRRLARV